MNAQLSTLDAFALVRGLFDLAAAVMFAAQCWQWAASRWGACDACSAETDGEGQPKEDAGPGRKARHVSVHRRGGGDGGDPELEELGCPECEERLRGLVNRLGDERRAGHDLQAQLRSERATNEKLNEALAEMETVLATVRMQLAELGRKAAGHENQNRVQATRLELTLRALDERTRGKEDAERASCEDRQKLQRLQEQHMHLVDRAMGLERDNAQLLEELKSLRARERSDEPCPGQAEDGRDVGSATVKEKIVKFSRQCPSPPNAQLFPPGPDRNPQGGPRSRLPPVPRLPIPRSAHEQMREAMSLRRRLLEEGASAGTSEEPGQQAAEGQCGDSPDAGSECSGSPHGGAPEEEPGVGFAEFGAEDRAGDELAKESSPRAEAAHAPWDNTS